MRQFAFAISSIAVMFATQTAQAQGFWYLPPGGDYSYRYGIDLGYGFGYGYGFGFGYGSYDSPYAAAAGAAGDLARLQNQYSVTGPQWQMDLQDSDVDAEPQVLQLLDQIQPLTVHQGHGGKALSSKNQAASDKQNKASSLKVTHIEFNPATGRVFWPSALERDEFSEHRSEMESLVKTLGKTGPTDEIKARINNKAQEMHDAMRRQFRAIPNKEYLEGQRFINRLATGVQNSVT